MLLLAVCALVVVSPLVVGRWPAGLLLHRWRWPALVWVALALQVVIMQIDALHRIAPVMHILTYVAAGVFLWLNRAMPGALIVGLGALSNGVTIALNGGVLPARAGAVEAAGLGADDAFANSAVVEDPVLPWLGDNFAWPDPLPLANTFSVGDVLIVVGVIVAAWARTRRIGAASVPAQEHTAG
ncbi:DUF5317 domain-containing protein [Demequina aestuarii]|uniref:DUF5317 domain-containing protein n=1 Tax=Demequina aestuarii TaxID=327095 RepID=UPI000783AEB7|nr:DUF5317 domain-containing protein [Demequina aestuarii]